MATKDYTRNKRSFGGNMSTIFTPSSAKKSTSSPIGKSGQAANTGNTANTGSAAGPGGGAEPIKPVSLLKPGALFEASKPQYNGPTTLQQISDAQTAAQETQKRMWNAVMLQGMKNAQSRGGRSPALNRIREGTPGNLMAQEPKQDKAVDFGGKLDDLSYKELEQMAERAQKQAESIDPMRNPEEADAAARNARAVRERAKNAREEQLGKASPGKVAGGVVWKGLNEIAGSASATLAAAEGLLSKPLGMILGNDELYKDAPFYQWNQSIQEEGDYFSEKYDPEFAKAGRIGELLGNYGPATIAAIPQALLAYATAGQSLAAQGTTAGLQATAAAAQGTGLVSTLGTAAKEMVKSPQYWASFATTVGKDYEQAREDGASELSAYTYATVNSLLNALVEIGGGGIDELPDETKGFVRNWIETMLDEGKEEVIQGAVAQLVQNVIYGKGNGLVSLTDENAVVNPDRMVQEFLGGAVVGGVLGGAQMGANRAMRYIYDVQTGKQVQMSQTQYELVQAGLNYDAQSETYAKSAQIARQLDSSEGAVVTSKDIGELYRLARSEAAQYGPRDAAAQAQSAQSVENAGAELNGGTAAKVMNPMAAVWQETAGLDAAKADAAAEVAQRVMNGDTTLTNREIETLRLQDAQMRTAFEQATGVELGKILNRSEMVRTVRTLAQERQGQIQSEQQQLDAVARQAEDAARQAEAAAAERRAAAEQQARDMLSDAVTREEQARTQETTAQETTAQETTAQDGAVRLSDGSTVGQEEFIRRYMDGHPGTGEDAARAKYTDAVLLNSMGQAYPVTQAPSRPNSRPNSGTDGAGVSTDTSAAAAQNTATTERHSAAATAAQQGAGRTATRAEEWTIKNVNYVLGKRRGGPKVELDFTMGADQNGYYDASTNTIRLNGNRMDGVEAGGIRLTNQEAIVYTLGHEITHAADARDGGALVRQVLDFAERQYGAERLDQIMDETRERYIQFYTNQGMDPTQAAALCTTEFIRQEVAADVMRSVFLSSGGVYRLARENAALLGRARDLASDMAQRLSARTRGTGEGSVSARAQYNELTRMVDRMDRALRRGTADDTMGAHKEVRSSVYGNESDPDERSQRARADEGRDRSRHSAVREGTGALFEHDARRADGRTAEAEIPEADGSGEVNENRLRYSVDPDSERDLRAVQNIDRKSINSFDSAETQATERYARQYWDEMGAKSPFFRAWFGDWRANDQTPVQIASERGDARGVQVNEDTGWSINISGKVFNETKAHTAGYNIEAVKYLPYINDIVKKAVLLDSYTVGREKAKSANSLLMHSLYAVADVGNGPEVLKLYVEEMNDPNSRNTAKRAYQLQNIEYQQPDAKGSGTFPSPSPVIQAADVNTVADLFAHVKGKNGNLTDAKPVSPVLLDEKGEPRTFYHGTGEEFNAFDINEASASEGSFFFAENPEDAAGYGGRVMEVYLSGENLADYDNQPSEFYQLRSKRDQVDYLKERGYDGWYADMDSGGWGEVSVFSPTQIKSAAENVGTFDAGNPDVRYSVTETEDGRTVAVVDSDILSHMDTTTWDDTKKSQAKKAAKEALLAFKDGIQVGNVTYKANKITRDEFTRSTDTERLYRRDPGVFADKMRAADIADDVLAATTDWANDGRLKHPRTDNFVDFAHGEVLIQAGNNQYDARTVVGINAAGESVFYDVVDMTPTNFKLKEEPSTAAADKDAVSAIQEGSFTNNISDLSADVKGDTGDLDPDVRYSVSSQDIFAKQVDTALDEDLSENRYNALYIRDTPNLLGEVGLGDLPLCITAKHVQSMVQEQSQGGHGLPRGLVKRLPELLSNPVMILDSYTKPGDIVVVTSAVVPSAVDNGVSPVVAAIHPNGSATVDGQRGPANFVTSVYGKDNFWSWVENNARHGNVLYWNQKKSQTLADTARVQFPGNTAQAGSNRAQTDTPVARVQFPGSVAQSGSGGAQTDAPVARVQFPGSVAQSGSNGTPAALPKALTALESDTILRQHRGYVKENIPARRFSAQDTETDKVKTGGNTGNVNPDTGYERGSVADSFARIWATGDHDGALSMLEQAAKTLAQAEAELAEKRQKDLVSKTFHPKLTEDALSRNRRVIDELIRKYGEMPQTGAAQQEVHLPRKIDGKTKTAGFMQTAAAAQVTGEAVRNELEASILNGDAGATYVPVGDKATLEQVRKDVEKRGLQSMQSEWDSIVSLGQGTGKNGMVTKLDIARAEQLYVEACNSKDVVRAQKLAAEIAAVGTQAGQTVQAMTLLKKMTPAGNLYYIQKAVDRLNKNQTGAHQDIVIDPTLARNLLDANTRSEIDTAMDALIQNLADQVPVTLGDKWNTWRYLAMLGNPRTHIRNLAGNAVFVPARLAKDVLAQIGELALPKEQRTKGWGFTSKETLDFARQDAMVMEDTLRGGGKYNMSDMIRDKRRIFKTRALNWINEKNSAALETVDWWFLKPAYTHALSGYLNARGADIATLSGENSTREGRALLNQARSYAIREAQRATYRDASKLAAQLNHAKRNSGKVGNALLEGILPFTKTPVNIVKRGVEYSPIGLINGVKDKLIKVRAGEMDAATAIDEIAAGATGTGILAIGYWLASAGVLVGKLGDDDDDQFRSLQGEQEYALRVDDVSYTIDWMAPVALPLFVGAEIYNAAQEDGFDPSIDSFVDALTTILEPMLSLSMLDGLNQTLSANKYDDDNMALYDIIKTMATSYVSQGVPTLFGQIARTIDGSRRSSFVQHGTGRVQSWMERTWQSSVQGKVPFYEEGKMLYVDSWGRTDTESSIAARVLENFVSPGYASRVTTTDVDAELERLAGATGDTGVYPDRAQSYFSVDGTVYNMTQDEYQAHLIDRGQTSYKLVSDIIHSAEYDAMTEDEKARAVKLAYEYAAAMAKTHTTDTYQPTEKWIGSMTAFTDEGGDAAQYLMLRAKSDGSVAEAAMADNSVDAGTLAQLVYLEVDTFPDTFEDPYASGCIYVMDAEQQKKFQSIYREKLEEGLDELMDSEEYRTGSAQVRKDLISDLKKQINADTRRDMSDWLFEQDIYSMPKE